jgi:hypothetical protein
LDLVHAEALVEDGRMPDGLAERYVVIRGTPDVQHAARTKTETEQVGYLRIKEAGGSLFAAIPRDLDDQSLTAFEGRYEGRMRRLSDTDVGAWIEQFFNAENIVTVADATPEALASALADAGGARLRVATEDGPVTLGPGDRMSIVVDQPEATVQLGKRSFDGKQAAEQAVAELGYPYAALERPDTGFYSFAVRIPDERRVDAERKLNAGLDVPADNLDPKRGAVVLPRASTYTVEAGTVAIARGEIGFPWTSESVSPGYELRDGGLVERSLADGMMTVALENVRAVRLEQPVRVDPDGYLIEVGVTPKAGRRTVVLWLVVLGIVALNLVSVVLMWRRRKTSGIVRP